MTVNQNRLNRRLVQLCAAAVSIAAVAPNINANPIMTVVTDTPPTFGMTIADSAPPPFVGGAFGFSSLYTFPFAYGVNWHGELTVTFINGNDFFGIPDVVQVQGNLKHIIAPHGEGAGTLFEFNLVFNASNPPGSPPQTASYIHGGDGPPYHSDNFSASLFAQFDKDLNISSYQFYLTANHTPGPGSLALLGMAGLIGRRSRRRANPS